MTIHNNSPIVARFRSLARIGLFGATVLLILSLFCRPTFAAVAISPEVVVLSGDQTVRVIAKVNTHLPVVVSLVELSSPIQLQSSREPNQANLWSGHTVARLSRQADGTFTTSFELNQQQPGTRYFQVAVRYAFSPFPNMNGTDLRAGVTPRPLTLPPDPGEAGKATLEGVDTDHDGIRDDVEREIFFMYPGRNDLRRVLSAMAQSEQNMIITQGDHEHFEQLAKSALSFEDCYNYLAYGASGKVPDTRTSTEIWSMVLNTPSRTSRFNKAVALATPFIANPIFQSGAACSQAQVFGKF